MSDISEAEQIICRRAMAVVARRHGLDAAAVAAARSRDAERARHIATYLAATAGRVPKKRLARILGVARFSVQRFCAVIEDQRDDPLFDRLLNKLEREIFQ